MDARTKLGVGAVLAILGGLGLVIIPLSGVAELEGIGGFLLGMIVGMACGAGAALALAGLFEAQRDITEGG